MGYHWSKCNAGISGTSVIALAIVVFIAAHARSVAAMVSDLLTGALIAAGSVVGITLVVTAAILWSRYRKSRRTYAATGARPMTLLSITRPSELVSKAWGNAIPEQGAMRSLNTVAYRPNVTLHGAVVDEPIKVARNGR